MATELEQSSPAPTTEASAYQEAVAALTQRLVEQIDRQHWRTAKRWTIFLILIWAGLTFLVSFGAESLAFNFFGWSFSFWLGAQGSLIAYVLLIAFYARVMNRADEKRQKQLAQLREGG